MPARTDDAAETAGRLPEKGDRAVKRTEIRSTRRRGKNDDLSAGRQAQRRRNVEQNFALTSAGRRAPIDRNRRNLVDETRGQTGVGEPVGNVGRNEIVELDQADRLSGAINL